MRWLVTQPGPAFSVADVYAGWVEALELLGEQVMTYNLDDRLSFYESVYQEVERDEHDHLKLKKALTKEQAVRFSVNGIVAEAYRWWPDVILIVSGFFIEPDLLDLLRSRRHKVVLLCTEQPYETDRELRLAAHTDLTLLNDPTNLDAFRQVTQAEYIPHAYRPSVHYPGRPDPKLAADLAFIGTGYPSRIEFFEQMHSGGGLDDLDVLLAGNWQALTEGSPLRPYLAHDPDHCIDNPAAASAYRSAKVGLNLYRREGDNDELDVAGYAMGPREVEMAACGMFYLRDPRPEGDELLTTLPRFTGPGEASELLRWWLDRPAQRERAAASARQAVTDRTFTNHAQRVLRLLDRQPVRA